MEPAKVCSTCKLPKLLTEFSVNRSKRDGRQSVCKGCQKVYMASYERVSDPNGWQEPRSVRRRQIVAENRQLLWAYLLGHPCVDCGETDIVVLDFDHRSEVPKVENISRMVAAGWPWKRIVAEIAKCDVVCANDHRRRTAQSQSWGKAQALTA
jgi:hypothetical protein